MNYKEFEKLTLGELIALEDYLSKRINELNELIGFAAKGSEIQENHNNSLVACCAIQSECRREIADRVEIIYPQFRI